MPLLINKALVEQDSWAFISDAETTTPTAGDVILPLARFVEEQDTLTDREGNTTFAISGDDDLSLLPADLSSFDVIGIVFPVLRDGRGFSIATHLRRNGYQGQLRALGEVTRDRLDSMSRCGIDAMQVNDLHFNEENVALAFAEMSARYQGAIDGSRPVYHQK
ncbi:MAG: DUF934 domain-containing protein [Pontibacterium sp.]